jgi:hypothetical protein
MAELPNGRGHRMMITCPADVYPSLKLFAQNCNMPEAQVVRLALEGIAPELDKINAAFDELRAGDAVGFVGMMEAIQSAMFRAQTAANDVMLTSTEALREAHGGTKKRKKAS